MPTCNSCKLQFETTQEDLNFYESAAPILNGKKYPIPAPTHCPDCRQQRRLAQSNEFNLYKSKCGLCNKFTLTYFPPHVNQPIYCRECWHSDEWDPRDYGQDYDPSRPFFDQWAEVQRKTPAQALSIQGTMENSEYVHLTGDSKNCYLIMHADHNEDCYYGYGIKKCKNCIDGFYNLYSELCYETIDSDNSYNLVNCHDCTNCSDSAFLRDCSGCQSCFLCVGLKNKQYCFQNKQYTKEEYEKLMSQIDLGAYNVYQHCLKQFEEMQRHHIYKEFQGYNLQNCFGMHLYNCKDTTYSFDCEKVEHGKFLYQIVLGAKDVYDAYQYGNNLELSYECSVCGLESYNLLFCFETHWCRNVYYSWYIENSSNLLGCSSMHHQNYCILNKQYSKEDYERLAAQIIEDMTNRGEYGEFFPIQKSPFGYNKSMAQIFYPLTQEQALSKGYKWDEYEPPVEATETISASELPNNIKDVDDSILDKAIKCEISGKPFKIIAQELKFYRQNNLPLPRLHWFERYKARLAKRNPRTFFDRTCDNCQKPIKTSYSPDRDIKVFCEECYLGRVY